MRPLRDIDRRIERIAESQHGAFTFTQARQLGASRDIIHTRTKQGRWKRCAPRVFAIAGAPTTDDHLAMVATLATPSSAISGSSAAAMHGVEGFDLHPLEVTTGPGANRRSPVATVRQRAAFRRTRINGVPVGTLDQTLVDLSGRISYRWLTAIAEQAIVDRRLHLSVLEEQLRIHDGMHHRGIADLRRFLETHRHGGAVPESELERHALPLLDQLGVPYVLQHPAPWDPTGRTRVDVLIPAWNLIIELDGYRWHATSAAHQRDVDRSNLATVHGYRLIRLTWTQIVEQPEATLALLRSLGPAR